MRNALDQRLFAFETTQTGKSCCHTIKQLEIQVIVTENLPEWNATAADLVHDLEVQQPEWRATDQHTFADELLNLRLTAILFPLRRPKRKDNLEAACPPRSGLVQGILYFILSDFSILHNFSPVNN